MGIWGFVASGGGTIGVLLGGVLVGTLGWPWIFLVNLPVGVLALALCRPLLDAGRSSGAGEGFDLAGAFLITTSILAAVYAIVGAETFVALHLARTSERNPGWAPGGSRQKRSRPGVARGATRA